MAFAICYGETLKAGRWRAVYANFDDDIIIGWAFVERLPRKRDVCNDYGSEVLALYVSTRYFTVGWMLTRSLLVLDLLFIKEKAEGVYERIGVRRVFENSTLRISLRLSSQSQTRMFAMRWLSLDFASTSGPRVMSHSGNMLITRLPECRLKGSLI
jgi:hypothetical protein